MPPSTIETELLRVLDAAGVRGTGVVVAVSGGRDSRVLLDLLARLADDRALELVVAHVNHGLRGDASDADETHVRETARALGLAFACRPVDPEAARRGSSSRRRPSPEEAARDQRRAALAAIAREHGCRFVATAHHAGDQAETLLLRLLRGTGPDGLAGMRGVDPEGPWIKPLLRVMPEEIQAWARARGLTWREDDSNRDPRFARNRLRHEWLPGLAEAFNPQLLRTLGQLAEAEGRDREWIATLVREAAEERIEIGPSGVRLAIDGWAGIPDALALRLVRYALVGIGLGRELSAAHLERVLAFLRRGRTAGRDKRLELPTGVVLSRCGDAFRLARLDRSGAAGGDASKGIDPCDDATVLGRD